jgi:hypothetical protein
MEIWNILLSFPKIFSLPIYPFLFILRIGIVVFPFANTIPIPFLGPTIPNRDGSPIPIRYRIVKEV